MIFEILFTLGRHSCLTNFWDQEDKFQGFLYKLRKVKIQVHFREGIGVISNHRGTACYIIRLLLWGISSDSLASLVYIKKLDEGTGDNPRDVKKSGKE